MRQKQKGSGKPAFAGTGYLAEAAGALPLSYSNQTTTSTHNPPYVPFPSRSKLSLFPAEGSVLSGSVLDLFLHHISGIHTCTLIAAGFEAQGSSTYSPVHVINLDIKDNHEEATLGSFLILELCEMVRPSG